jgi:hypothetical protein
VIAPGVDRDLDELRELSRNSKQVLAQIEQRERGRTGIASLKVKFNSIFGYYLEVSKSNLHLVPQDYERKQTLVGAERFTTPELKEYEAKILDAQEKIVEIERRLFTELRTAIAAEAKRIRQTASGALAEVDVLASLAHVAALRNYCRPQFVDAADAACRRTGDYRRPAPGDRAAGDGRRQRALCAQRSLLERVHAHDFVADRAEHGRQVDLSAANRADRHSGADGIVRSGAVGAAERGGSRVHSHRSQRQPGARAVDLHGRDDGDRSDPAYGDGAIADPIG